MKLKKILSVIAAGVFAGALFTGCGADKGDNSAQSGEFLRLGMISTLNASEKKVDEVLKMVEEKSNVKVMHHTTTFYKDLSTMQMGLESGSVDEISTYQCVAKYLIAHNPKLEPVENHGMSLSDSFCFAMRKDEVALKKNIDNAITEMKKDGTLDKLVKEYVTDVKDKEPPAVEIPHIDGAEGLKVAVTGDLPPIDLVLADGKPAGFNTALLAELGKRLNRNIEILDIDGDARAAALTSKQADVIFWAILPVDDRPKDMDTPEGAILSEPYFTDKIEHLKLKK
ncbi:MAG: transporter substrate-binding domain-containing protein [Selenomonadaceae bacterium]|nr:transporter substrate-binding domain-containing protein [Selenomonadaceae bacterium]